MTLVVLSKHDICFAQMHRLFCLNLIGCALCHYGIEDCRRSVSPVCLLVDKKAGTLGR